MRVESAIITMIKPSKKSPIKFSRGETGFLLPGWSLVALQKKMIGFLPALPRKQEDIMGEPYMCLLVFTEDRYLCLTLT